MSDTHNSATRARQPKDPADGAMNRSVGFLRRFGVLVAMVLTIVGFCILSPDAFFSIYTFKSILRDTAPLLVAALGITFILIMYDFDLSVGGMIALLATVGVMLISADHAGLPVVLGVLLTLLLGAGLGLFNGVMVSYVKLPSFILTIAMGTVFAGLGLRLTGSRSVFGGIPEGYGLIARGDLFGISNQILIGLACLVVAHVFLRHTEAGRYLYAIGGNPEVSRLAGVRVRLLKSIGYMVVGIGAALAAILLTSQANAANPNTGLGLLLPIYAAAFLGSSVLRPGVFTAIGTAIAALFMQAVGTGLTILNLSGPDIQIIQGIILVLAILVSRLNRSAAP